MHWITRTAATAATTLALALPSVGVAQASSAPAPTSTTTVVAATCHYTVTGNGVAVRRSPDNTAHVIKRKNRGNHVTGPAAPSSTTAGTGSWSTSAAEEPAGWPAPFLR